MRKFRQHPRRSDPMQRLILGIFIVIIGALALVDNLGLFDSRQILTFWPTIFIVLGVLKMSRANRTYGFLIGGIMLGAGVLLTLQNLGYIVFHWRDWWPVVIIFFGISFIFKGTNTKYGSPESYSAQLSDDAVPRSSDSIEIVAIMSASKTSNSTTNFQGGDITAIMGSAELDLRNASLTNEAVIQVFSVFGSVEIFVPNDWLVIVNGVPILGGIEDHSVPPVASTKRLIISGMVVMGGVEIKN